MSLFIEHRVVEPSPSMITRVLIILQINPQCHTHTPLSDALPYKTDPPKGPPRLLIPYPGSEPLSLSQVPDCWFSDAPRSDPPASPRQTPGYAQAQVPGSVLDPSSPRLAPASLPSPRLVPPRPCLAPLLPPPPASPRLPPPRPASPLPRPEAAQRMRRGPAPRAFTQGLEGVASRPRRRRRPRSASLLLPLHCLLRWTSQRRRGDGPTEEVAARNYISRVPLAPELCFPEGSAAIRVTRAVPARSAQSSGTSLCRWQQAAESLLFVAIRVII